MLIPNTLRAISVCFYLLKSIAPARYAPFRPVLVYYVLVGSFLLLSAFRMRWIYKHPKATVVLSAYASLPFLWTVYSVVRGGELFRDLLSASLCAFALVVSAFLPVVLLLEYRLSAKQAK